MVGLATLPLLPSALTLHVLCGVGPHLIHLHELVLQGFLNLPR